ncbi:hypothetical protein PK34_18925 [Stutzerimonas stutzeri]|uniref:hypothetical protein n=1 Tax=Stutzerimonas stutzeri TaxID=316 RepID=UPI000628146E|nr:hypothetical protein PK34_18925 [Stutzerimonas stutzeri]
MKIYVVSNGVQDTANQLVKQLAKITLQDSKASPVIVVDDRYNLDQVSEGDASVANTSYRLDDFLHDKGSIADGVMMVDANQIATKLNELGTEWVLFEFGQNDKATCFDFVRKLARYNFMTPTLRDRSVVFSVPSIYLGHFASAINESFNNLPAGPLAVDQSGQVGMLLMSIRIERVFVSLPLLSAPLIRMNRLVMFVYRRFSSV